MAPQLAQKCLMEFLTIVLTFSLQQTEGMDVGIAIR